MNEDPLETQQRTEPRHSPFLVDKSSHSVTVQTDLAKASDDRPAEPSKK